MAEDGFLCVNRRSALATVAGGALAARFVPGDLVEAATGEARLQDGVYPELRVAKLGDLEAGVPQAFAYPLKQQPNLLMKLGAEAFRGVGQDRDIVAYSVLCTHMGGSLRGRYRHDLKATGPCPFHFSRSNARHDRHEQPRQTGRRATEYRSRPGHPVGNV